MYRSSSRQAAEKFARRNLHRSLAVQRWIGTAVATPTSPKIIVYAAIGLLDAEGDAMDVVNSF
jgi:hypothetical protein